MKTCSKCNIDREINRYHKSSGDKYRPDCIPCHKESMSKINRDIKGLTR